MKTYQINLIIVGSLAALALLLFSLINHVHKKKRPAKPLHAPPARPFHTAYRDFERGKKKPASSRGKVVLGEVVAATVTTAAVFSSGGGGGGFGDYGGGEGCGEGGGGGGEGGGGGGGEGCG
ncbi:hypothetical protein CASFOL_041810 [Castilleja foliolosa]|uniref:Glycine-rich protein n=1 Tax=Castilleja foliolosa TaxID=1961234 RepID=A0ABD3B9E3_9LAMI